MNAIKMMMLPSIVLSLIFFSLLAFFGIPLNAVTLSVVMKRRRKTSTQIFIIALAMTDLFVCLCTPLLWYIFTPTNMFYTDIACITITFIAVVSLLQSTLIGATIAIDRYFLVCQPHSQFMTNRRRIAITASCLVVSLILAFFAAFYTNGELYDHNVFRCVVPKGSIGSVFEKLNIIVIVVCGGLIVVFYLRVYRALRQQRRVKVHLTPHLTNDVKIQLHQRQSRTFSVTKQHSSRIDIEMTPMNTTQTTTVVSAVNSLSENVAASTNCESPGDVENAIDNSITPVAISVIKHDVGTPSMTPKSKTTAQIETSSSESNQVVTHRRDTDIVNAAQLQPNRFTPAERQATNMMLVITGVFLISYIPTIVTSLIPVEVMVEIASQSSHLYLFIFFLRHTVYISNAVNPLVYGFMNTRFRREFISELKCRKPREDRE